MTYTLAAVLGVVGAVLVDLVLLRTRLLATSRWWMAYAIVVFFQLLSNGWLTGRGIVRYADEAVLGGAAAVPLGDGRLLYAPVEDLAFGFALVLQTLAWWVFWGRRGVQRAPRPLRRAASGPARAALPPPGPAPAAPPRPGGDAAR